MTRAWARLAPASSPTTSGKSSTGSPSRSRISTTGPSMRATARRPVQRGSMRGSTTWTAPPSLNFWGRQRAAAVLASSRLGAVSAWLIRGSYIGGRDPMIRDVTAGVERRDLASRLAALTPSGRARVPLGWALYDFANTIFSFAIVSGAIGLWLTRPEQFGERDGNVLLSVAVLSSVAINAIV